MDRSGLDSAIAHAHQQATDIARHAAELEAVDEMADGRAPQSENSTNLTDGESS